MDQAISLNARRIDLPIELPFQLGAATANPRAHEIGWGRESRRLQPLTMKVLVALHDKIGEVVTRDELVDRCWDGRFVGEDVINRCISLLRRVADESGSFEIETVPRAGYRLVEKVTSQSRRPPQWIAGAIGIAAVAAVAATLLPMPRRHSAAPATLEVAVLPFTAEQGNAVEQRLAGEAGDSVARMLGESGFSVKSGDGPPRAGSDLVVSGHIGNDGGGLVATVNVEDVPRQAMILSHRLEVDGGQSANLPDEIGANVAGSLSWADRLIQLDKQHPSDPAIISQVLDQFSNEDFDFWRTYEFARRHAPSAPNSAVAQWQLAMVTGLMMHGMPMEDRPSAVAAARTAAERARTLDPQLGDFSVPWCTLHPQVRMLECEDRLRAALKVDPQAAWAPTFLGNLMNSVGRTDDALMLDAASLAEDQYAPSKIAQAIIMFEAVGDDRQAQSLYERGARLWPTTRFLLKLRVQGITESGDFAALERLPRQVGAAHVPDHYASVLALARAVSAHSVFAARAACPKDSADQFIAMCMTAFGQLGDLDDAFAYADEVYPPRLGRTAAENDRLWFADPFVLSTAFLTGRGAAPMRRDPRYLPLARRLGLLDYWRSGRLPDFCTHARELVCAQISRRG